MKGNYVMLRAGTLRLVLPQDEVGAAHHLDETAREDNGRFIAVDLAGTTRCWDEMRVLIGLDLQPVELPAALRAADSPVASYIELDGEPAFLCSADAVQRVDIGAAS
jgi:hypothetical protein